MISDIHKTCQSVGEASLKLRENSIDLNAIEIQREVHKGSNSEKSYEEEIQETILNGKKEFPKKNFYIIILLKKERTMVNVVRQYFFPRKSCPTPEYDQTAYKFHFTEERIEYLWTIPDIATCMWLPRRKHELPDDQLLLVSMIEAFRDGDLDKLSAKLNGEKKLANLIPVLKSSPPF